MKAKSALSLAVVAGVAASATAGNTPANRELVPLRKAGVLYVNMQTGERTLTLYNQGDVAEVDVNHGTAALFEYWISIDENPCWDDARADGFGWGADGTADVAAGLTEPIVGWDYGDMPFDSVISGVVLNTAVLATENTDSNLDGTLDTGLDTVGVYYDGTSDYKEDPGRGTSTAFRSSTTPPTAAIRIESIPGNRGEVPNGFSDYDLILDFGSDHFELGDSDGLNQGALYLAGAAPGRDVSEFDVNCTTTPSGAVNCTTTANTNADGLADIQYLQFYAQHGTNDKVTANSTFIGLGTPEGTVTFSTFVTTIITTCTTPSGALTTCTISTPTTSTFLTADPAPQGQKAYESFGIGMLGAGADTTNINNSIAGCCFWFGGVGCGGFLAQLVEEPVFNSTYYNFNPYGQDGHGFFTNEGPNPCLAIDFNGDTFLDNGDIGAFLGQFLLQSPSADLNGDGVVDNGDIGTFVQIFLSCVG